jgi:hypothetical protein
VYNGVDNTDRHSDYMHDSVPAEEARMRKITVCGEGVILLFIQHVHSALSTSQGRL